MGEADSAPPGSCGEGACRLCSKPQLSQSSSAGLKGHPGSGCLLQVDLSSLQRRRPGLLGPLVSTTASGTLTGAITRDGCLQRLRALAGKGPAWNGAAELGSFTGASPPHDPAKPALLTGHPTEVIYSDCQFGMCSPSDRGWSEINFGIFDLH